MTTLYPDKVAQLRTLSPHLVKRNTHSSGKTILGQEHQYSQLLTKNLINYGTVHPKQVLGQLASEKT